MITRDRVYETVKVDGKCVRIKARGGGEERSGTHRMGEVREGSG